MGGIHFLNSALHAPELFGDKPLKLFEHKPAEKGTGTGAAPAFNFSRNV
jgi:hypothetical protein